MLKNQVSHQLTSRDKFNLPIYQTSDQVSNFSVKGHQKTLKYKIKLILPIYSLKTSMLKYQIFASSVIKTKY